MSEALLGAIDEYVTSNAKDDSAKEIIEALGGVAARLKPKAAPGTSPGKLAAKMAASKEDAPAEAKPQVSQDPQAEPKTFAEAKAAAMEMVTK